MLTANQIKAQTFPQVSRGAYRAQEVDAFMQKVAQTVAELQSENANLKKKFASLSGIIEEYNQGKNAIATALVKAQVVADETVETAQKNAEETMKQAQESADQLRAEKAQEAEAYAKEKKETADAYFEKAQSELRRILSEAETQSRAYMDEVNAQAAAIIKDANEKAAMLVAAAYKDAQTAKDLANEIVEKAKVEMETTKNAMAAFKQSASASLSTLLPLIQGIDLDEFAAPELTALQNEILPPMETAEAEAPKLDLNQLFNSFDMTIDQDAKELQAEESAFEAEEQEDPAFEQPQEAEIAEEPEAVEAIEEIEEIDPPTASNDAELAEEGMPVYHPFELPKQQHFSESLFDQPKEEELSVEIPVEEIDLPPVQPKQPEPVARFQERDVEEPQQMKFKLTKNFDIFDED